MLSSILPPGEHWNKGEQMKEKSWLVVLYLVLGLSFPSKFALNIFIWKSTCANFSAICIILKVKFISNDWQTQNFLLLAEALTREKFSSSSLWYPAALIIIFLIQEYYHLLQERVVAYINVDIAVSGFYLFLLAFFLFLKEDPVYVSPKSDFARTFFMSPSVCHMSPQIKSSFCFPLSRKLVES